MEAIYLDCGVRRSQLMRDLLGGTPAMWAFWRLLQSLLQQPWAASAATTVALLCIGGGILGLALHWHSYLTFFVWGVIWAVAAIGAWIINR
jgi:hypothetical protein